METIYRKYFNNTCSPEEFAEIIKRFQDPSRETEVINVMTENWNNIYDEEKFVIANQRLLDKIHQAIAAKELQSISHKNKFLFIGMKVAAALIVALLISSIILVNKLTQQQSSNLTQVISTPYGAKTKLTLPDGSRVWLNSGTRISFPQTFGKERKIELKGEAFFNVVKNGKPFLVNTTQGLIEVLGTAFDVKSFDHETFETTLIRGSIKLKNHDTNQEILLHPGQQALINKNKTISINQVDTTLFTSWKDGKLIFHHKPLCSISKQLERWYNVKIILKDKSIENLQFTGTIEMESFNEVLLLIKKTTPIKYSYNAQTRTLIIMSKQ